MKRTLFYVMFSLFILGAATFAVAQDAAQPKENATVSTNMEMAPAPKTDVTTSPVIAKAIAKITGTAADSKISGEVALAETPDGVTINATFRDVPPGEHGFHVHENGSCDDAGKAAGGHFNPMGSPHGLLPRDGMDKAHAGDMGNVTINENGEGVALIFLPGVTLNAGPHSINGKAIILHEKTDDFSQPTGNAGGRIGCGIISLQ